jgi:hypothetical protein
MAKSVKEILKFALVVIIIFFGTICIQISNQREYTRSEYRDIITYPLDVNLNMLERNGAGLGKIIFVILMIAIVYFFSLGAIQFFKKHSEKFGISSFNMLILSTWIFCIGIYALVTSQFGIAFILDPFFGKKIYYGGYERVIHDLNNKIGKVSDDNYQTDEVKKEKLEEIKQMIHMIESDKYREFQHVESLKNLK